MDTEFQSGSSARVILLAEDEQLVRDLVENVLTLQGYLLLCAADGMEALEISRSYPGEIQLLLSDMKMPKMDGLELSRHIALERPTTKVLLMSGISGEIPVSDMPSNFLRKPFLAQTLRAAVSVLI